MAHIALIVTGLTGRLHSSFKMASKLKKEGHSITYLCPQDVKKKVETIGFDYVQLDPINIEIKNAQSNSWFNRCQYHFNNYSKHYETGKKLLGLNKYKNELKK